MQTIARIIIEIAVYYFAVAFADLVIDGITISDIPTGALVGISILLVFRVIRPVLKFITIPINFITLGFFSIILNFIVVIIIALLISSMNIGTVTDAALFTLIAAIIIKVFDKLFKIAWPKKKK